MRNLKAYGEPFHFLQEEETEMYAVPTAQENQVWHLFLERSLRVNPHGDVTAGVGVVLVSPQNHVMPPMLILTNLCSNNMAETM